MKDLSSERWIKAKGGLFLLSGSVAAVLLWLDQPTWKTALLLAVVVWCYCRSYYFAFYVIEHYVDSSFRFSGIGSFMRYLIRNRRRKL